MSHIYEHVDVSMRDGVNLSGILFRPISGTTPTLVVRTPYGLSAPIAGNQGTLPKFTAFLDAGFAVLWVECRGTSASEGVFRTKVDEVDDGYDTLDWIVAQPWSNGDVGAYGLSYFGMTQWAMTISGHPALRAVAPVMTAMDWYKGTWYSPGGALSHAITTPWHLLMRLAKTARDSDSQPDALTRLGELNDAAMSNAALEYTPLTANPLLVNDEVANASYHQVLAHPAYDEFWREQDFTQSVEKINAPALVITGWYDIFIAQTLDDFRRIREHGSNPAVRDGSRLIVGPWDHYDSDMTGQFAARDFGMHSGGAAVNLTSEHLDHFNRHLMQIEDQTPPSRVKLFVMGADEWRDEDDWPLPGTTHTDFYLGESHLSKTRPEAPTEHTYLYDPQDPVRTTTSERNSALWQPNDQRDKDGRADVLTFSTPTLEEPIEVIGHVTATLWVSSDAVDTDFTAQLIDVFPDGRAINLCHGIIRMRYRAGLTDPTLMTPGEVYEAEIDMAVTANVFLPGHKIRVDISSSNFPRFDRNTNTGGDISSERIEGSVTAQNTLYIGSDRPSRITLPIPTR